MPRIPIFERQVSASAGSEINLPRVNADDFGAGIGRVLEGRGNDMQAAEAAQKRAELEAEKNAAMTAAALAQAQAEAVTAEEIATARQEAESDGASHVARVTSRLDAVQATVLENVTHPAARAWVEQQMVRLRVKATIDEGGYAAGLRADKVTRDFAAGRDIAANNLFVTPNIDDLQATLTAQAQVVDTLALPADAKAKLTDETRKRLTRSYAEGLAERDPYALREQLDSGVLNEVLAPEDLTRLRGKADSEVRGLEAAERAEQNRRKAEANAAKREAAAVARDQASLIREQVRSTADYLRDGGTISSAELQDVTRAAASAGDPALARTVARLGIQAVTNTELRGSTPLQVEETVQRLQAKVNAAGDKARAEDLIALDATRDFQSTAQQRLRTDPIGWAAEQGVVTLAPLDASQPDSYAARVRAVDTARARFGGSVSPLTPAEVEALSSQLDKGTPDQKLQVLSQLGGLGKYRGQAMQQLAGDNPTYGHVGRLIGAVGGAGTARDALEGMELAKKTPKLFEGNTKSVVLGEAAAVLGRLPDVLRALPGVSDGIFAARRSRAGLTEWDEDGYRRALNAGLGAYQDRSGVMRGGLGEWNGTAVLLPDSVSQDEFEDGMEAATIAPDAAPRDRRGKPLTMDDLRGQTIVTLGAGVYGFSEDGGRSLIARPDGEAFRLFVRPKGGAK